jgi:hypothetical protein
LERDRRGVVHRPIRTRWPVKKGGAHPSVPSDEHHLWRPRLGDSLCDHHRRQPVRHRTKRRAQRRAFEDRGAGKPRRGLEPLSVLKQAESPIIVPAATMRIDYQACQLIPLRKASSAKRLFTMFGSKVTDRRAGYLHTPLSPPERRLQGFSSSGGSAGPYFSTINSSSHTHRMAFSMTSGKTGISISYH